MSGIYGFLLKKKDRSETSCRTILEAMRCALPTHTDVSDHSWTSTNCRVGLGGIHPKAVHHPIQIAVDEKNRQVCLLDGYLFSTSQYPSEISHNKSGATYLLQQYQETGPTCVKNISGSFNVVWYDERPNRLVLATDKIGHRLFYYGSRNGDFVFASYIARIMASDLISSEINLESFSNLLRISYIPGESTLFKDIRCMPPGSILTFEKETMKIKKYWGINEIEPYGEYSSDRLDELESLFKTAVVRTLTSGVKTAIDLTGGLDSRCILAAAASTKLPCIAHTGGQPDSTDVVLAQKTAAVVNVEHFFEFIGPDNLSDWLTPMVLYQGGMAATLHSHPCQHFGMDFPFGAYIQGTGPPNYIGIHPKYANSFDIKDKNQAHAVVMKANLENDLEQRGVKDMWREKYKALGAEAFENHVRRLLDDYVPNDRMIAFIDFYAMTQSCRKFLNKANVIVRNVREHYFPYLDHELLTGLAKLPIQERTSANIQFDLIKRMAPKLLKVPLAKTMRPMQSSRFLDWVQGKYWSVKTRVGRKTKNPRQQKPIPNHYLVQWSRNEMRKQLEMTLYNPKAAFREYLSWEPIETLLDQHFSGQHDWESVIGALVVFEISHNLWVDKSKKVEENNA